jgi:hypothetical protein
VFESEVTSLVRSSPEVGNVEDRFLLCSCTALLLKDLKLKGGLQENEEWLPRQSGGRGIFSPEAHNQGKI